MRTFMTEIIDTKRNYHYAVIRTDADADVPGWCKREAEEVTRNVVHLLADQDRDVRYALNHRVMAETITKPVNRNSFGLTQTNEKVVSIVVTLAGDMYLIYSSPVVTGMITNYYFQHVCLTQSGLYIRPLDEAEAVDYLPNGLKLTDALFKALENSDMTKLRKFLRDYDVYNRQEGMPHWPIYSWINVLI